MKKDSIGISNDSPQREEKDDLLKVSEVADILRTTRLTVLRYIHDKRLRAIRISERKILVPRSSLTRFIEKSEI